MIRKISGVLAVILAVVLLYYSVAPVPPIETDISYFDKIEHVGAYFVLALLIYIASKKALLSFLISGVYGVLMELVQNLLAYRFFSIFDVIANFVGAFLIFFIWLFYR